MARERIPHPEFLVYAREMERIKKIILKVASEGNYKDSLTQGNPPHNRGRHGQSVRHRPHFLRPSLWLRLFGDTISSLSSNVYKPPSEPVPQDPEDTGAQAQKIRRMLEIIVNACLVVQMAIGDAKHLRRFVNKSRAEVLRGCVDGNHYPSIADEPSRLSRPIFVVASGVGRNEYLTRDRWFTVWGACGTLVHEERPGSTRPKPRYDTYLKDSRTWLQWIINLLSLHRIVTKDLQYQALISLYDTRAKGALISVTKRVTPWQTSAYLPEGGVATLQFNVDGEWQNVTDPEQGAITLAKIIGYYTAQSYFPVNG